MPKKQFPISISFARLLWSCGAVVLIFLSFPVLAQVPDSFNPGANGWVTAFALQPDGKILVGGDFTTLGGQSRAGLGRLNPDGSVDMGFNPAIVGGVSCLALQPDGKILIGGYFTSFGGQGNTGLGRLTPEGGVDSSFSPGADGQVYCLALQPDGKILVGGSFTALGGEMRSCIGRLSAAGQVDTSFNPGANDFVYALALQPDGKILVGGDFTTLAGAERAHLGRLNPDGSIDSSFNPGADGMVSTFASQADGKIVVGGWFITLAGVTRHGLGRLNADGSLDTSFLNPALDSGVFSLALQTDGRIVVSGDFRLIGGATRDRIARLNAAGTLDAGFDPGASADVRCLALQEDGKILAGGAFSILGGATRNNIGRLNNSAEASQSLARNGSTLTWLRGGTGPEAWRTTFEYSANNVDWITLGSGTRISGGWRLTGVILPYSVSIRGRGFVTGGQFNGSSWCVEETIGSPPWIGTQPQPLSRTNDFGTAASFYVSSVEGTPPLSLQWRKDENDLVDGGHVSGSKTHTLTLNPVTGADTGEYSLVVTNLYGSVTSSVATLTVRDPILTSQTGSMTRDAGTTAFFSVGVTGSVPLSYQWYKDGVSLNDGGNLSGSTTDTLMVDAVLGGDRGLYSVVVTNSYGSVTSSVAYLAVRDPVVTNHPTSLIRNAGTAATFSVQAVGTLPFSYQWLKNGTNLVDDANVSGATDETLVLGSVFGKDRGGYSVVVTSPYGSVTSTVATLTVVDPVIISQPASQSAALGETVTFSVGVSGSTPLSYLWRKDDSPLPGALSASLVLSNVSALDAGHYDVIVTNVYGSATSTAAILTLDPNLATVDPTFNSGANGNVWSLALQPDGSILVGGDFTSLGGQPRNRIGRLDSDGTIDPGFDPDADNPVYCLTLQPDGKILVGGSFATLSGAARTNLGRLNPDGTLDGSFDPGSGGSVSCLVVQPDSAILVGGTFNAMGGQTRDGIARLHNDGSLDDTFNPGSGQVVVVYSMAMQADGKILVAGQFLAMADQPRTNIARLNSDGTLDGSFSGTTVNGRVYCMAGQADGRILIGGEFTSVGGEIRSHIGRLNADGTLDATFNPGANGIVFTLAVQADGKILVGGSFTTLGGDSRQKLGRLNPDGTPDAAFNPGVIGTVYSLALQSDGKVLAGGAFSALGGEQRNCLGRLINPTPATQTLTHVGSTLTWLRGGSGPEVWHSTFQSSSNGLDWINLGTGNRISGGWELTNVILASDIIIRARGEVTSGCYDGSSWLVESSIGPPFVLRAPAALATDAGTSATFKVVAAGSEPLSYQWRWNGLDLADDGNISGASTPILSLVGVFGTNAGEYSVVIKNSYGSVTSAVANLTVADPVITHQPVSRNNDAGTTATFSVDVVGSDPLSYQWRWNGMDLADNGNVSGATSPMLRLEGVLWANAGGYSVVTTNSYGSVTSVVANLTVADPVITAQPVSQTNNVGTTATFRVDTAGTEPLSYQWRRNGMDLANDAHVSGATTNELTVTDVLMIHAGDYSVVVTNAHGSVTSLVATLTVQGLPDQFVRIYLPGWCTSPPCWCQGFAFCFGYANGDPISSDMAQYYHVQASTNLAQWISLTNGLVAANGMLCFCDTNAPAHPKRFYRVIVE